MRLFSICAIAGLLALPGAALAASASQDAMKTCSASWKTKSDAEKKVTTYNAYMSSCMKGGGAASPAPAATATTAKGGSMTTCAASWKAMSDAAKKATTYKAYMSTCMKGSGSASAAPAKTMTTAAKPAPAPAPAAKASPSKTASSKIPTEGHTGTSARCKDGKVIPIKSHTGACSHHGGVAAWL